MKLSEFRILIRAVVPGAKISVIDEPTLDILINKGVNEVNVLTGALVGSEPFDVVAEVGDYDIPTEGPTAFIRPGLSGLWWYNGTEWKELDAYTMLQLKNEFPMWMNDSSADPQRYAISGDRLVIHPKPDTSATGGFKFDDYVKAATPMSSGDQYPFTGTTSELVRLRTLDDAIIDYVRWRLQLMVGKDEKGTISEQYFYNTVNTRMMLVNSRPDLRSNPDFRMRGPTIGK